MGGDNFTLGRDWDGRLRKAQAGVATKYMTAKYTPDGVRIAKTRSFGDADDYDHKYIVDVSGKLPKILLILDASTEDILKTFIHANNQVVAQHDGDTSDNLYFYTHDRLGSVRQVFDPADLSVKNNYAYDAWGQIVDGETTGNIWNPYLFAGYLWDSEILMYYCNARQYDPVLGRFTSRDRGFGELKTEVVITPPATAIGSGKKLQERSFKVIREQIAPTYSVSSGAEKPRDLSRWLPERYRRQLRARESELRSLRARDAVKARESRLRLPRWYNRQYDAIGKKEAVRSFQHFKNQSTRDINHKILQQQPKSDKATKEKKNASD